MNKFGVPQLQNMEKFGATENEISHQLIELCCTDMSYFVLGSAQIIHGHLVSLFCQVTIVVCLTQPTGWLWKTW